MDGAYFSLASGDFSQDWSNPNQIIASDDWSGVPSIIGYAGSGLTNANDIDPSTVIAVANDADVIANSNPTSSSGGVHELETEGVVALQGSGSADAPNLVLHLDSTGRQEVRVRYTLKEVDTSDANQQFALQFRTNTGDFATVPGTHVVDTFNAAGAQMPTFDFTLPAAANDAATLEVRFITTNATGADSMIGVDDIIVTSSPISAGQNFRLQVLHASDLEGGFDAITNAPNFAAIVESLESDTANFDASILLSAGDNYIPGPFFNAAGDQAAFRNSGVFNDAYNTLFGTTAYAGLREGNGRVDVSIMNILGFDASAIGNHEFDGGSGTFASIIAPEYRGAGLGDDRWVGAQFPYLSANIDFGGDASLSGLFTGDVLENTAFASGPAQSLAGTAVPKIAPSTIITRGGESIGVIGATTQFLGQISSPSGSTIIDTDGIVGNDMDELAAILNPQIAILQSGLDGIAGNADDLNKIILVSHLQQLSLEEELIGLLDGVDVVIAGGSDTLLADGNDVLRAGDAAEGPYPIFTMNADEDPAVIVSTDGEYSYVGRLIVEFDPAGVLVAPTMPESSGNPQITGVYPTDEAGVLAVTGATDLTTAIAGSTKATEVKKLTDAVLSVVQSKDGDIAGRVGVYLEGRREFVRTQETNMGNLTADANLAAAKTIDPTVVVSIKNGGGIRDAIGTVDGITGELGPNAANPATGKLAGEVSQLDIENSLRFNNSLSILTVTAAELVQVLEHGVAATAAGNTPGQFAQVGGVSFSFDPGLPSGSRVRSVAITDELGTVIDPILDSGAIVGDSERPIRIVTLGFLADGGDSYPFPSLGENRVDFGSGEQAALTEFLIDNHSVVPYYSIETPIEQDRRIQNLAFRPDSVLSEIASNELPLTRIGGVAVSGAEISAFDPVTDRLYVTAGGGVEVIDLSNPASPAVIGLIDPTVNGASSSAVTSVAIASGDLGDLIALAVPAATKTDPGSVYFYKASTGQFAGSVTVGALPDMLTFTADGTRLLVANEGESDGGDNEPNESPNPNGSVSIISVDVFNPGNSLVRTFDFADPSITFASLSAVGVRVNRTAPSVAADLEPEYITISGNQAFITLQENNAVAVIEDITTFTGFTIGDILPLGMKDHRLPQNSLDPSNRDDGVAIANYPVMGQYMPDAIASYTVGGQTYFVTANEGDGRGVDEDRIADLTLDNDAILFAADLQDDAVLGRLTASLTEGDVDGDGIYESLNVFGGRSFSIWNSDGTQVFDSGNFMERFTALSDSFADSRSDDKGPEPEGVTIGSVGGQTYAFVGLERTNDVMVFNISNPLVPQFVGNVNHPGDVSPEGLTFIDSAISPNGNALLVITNEVSGTVSVIDLEAEPIVPELVAIEVNAGVSFTGSTTDQRSQVVSIRATFNDGVSLIGDAITITNTTTGQTLGPSQLLISEVSQGVFDIAFGVGTSVVTRNSAAADVALWNSLADGDYRISFVAGAVVSSTGTASETEATDNFFRFFGDNDGDGDVDARDFLSMRIASLVTGRTNAALDADGDGDTFRDADDTTAFLTNFRKAGLRFGQFT